MGVVVQAYSVDQSAAKMELDRSRVFDYWLHESAGFSLRCAVLEFKRSPRAFCDQLSQWPLSHIGGALHVQGFDWTLRSAAFRCGSRTLGCHHGTDLFDISSLHPRHIIVSLQFEAVLMSAMSTIPSVQNVKVRRRYDFNVLVFPEIHVLIGPDELARRVLAASTMEAIFG